MNLNQMDISTFVGNQNEFMKGKQLVAGVIIADKRALVTVDQRLSAKEMREVRKAFNEAMDTAIRLQESQEGMRV